jgi:hypothetical protein
MSKSHLNPFEFDSRVVDWNIKNKLVTQEKIKTFRSALPDDGHNCEPLHIEVDEAEGIESELQSN